MNDRYENDYIIGLLMGMVEDLKTEKPIAQVIDCYAGKLTTFKAGIEIGIMRDDVKELVEACHGLIKVSDLWIPHVATEEYADEVRTLHGIRQEIIEAIAKVEGL